MEPFGRVEECARDKHPRIRDVHISYGTAGFRTKSCELDHVIFRMGLLAVLASKARKATIGVMITASHNPEEDNGVKLVDQYGEMMPPKWETYATHLANVSDSDLVSCLKNIMSEESLDMSQPAKVVYAQDTRPSSGPLAQALADGIQVLEGEATNYGLLTTPQLHYMVMCHNTAGTYGTPTEQGYYQKLSAAFVSLLSLRPGVGKSSNYTKTLYLDAANGVGAPKMTAMLEQLQGALSVHLVNDGSTGKLNFKCGADFVKIQQTFPVGLEAEPGERCASFDGDADRLVYFYKDSNGKFNLLDGDKIATLVAGYLQELVRASGLQLNFGLVQTAYANGSSTCYITEELKVPVACVPTGVKYLHHKAQEFDIGVYFEANGHGTILFSKEAMAKVKAATQDSSLTSEQKEAALCLSTMIDLINQTVGDAISDLLVVETILWVRGWSIIDWNNTYTDLPNRQLKVKVADRAVVTTADAERKAISPQGLQAAIDQLVTHYPHGRSFVRPSGTEDVVRVYAESDTQEHADQLAQAVAKEVHRLAGGVGDLPAAH